MSLNVQLVVSALCVDSKKVYVLMAQDYEKNVFLPSISLPTGKCELTIESVKSASYNMFAKIFSIPVFTLRNSNCLMIQDADTGTILIHNPYSTHDSIRILHSNIKHTWIQEFNASILNTKSILKWCRNLYIGLMALMGCFCFGVLINIYETLYLVIPICIVIFLLTLNSQPNKIISQSYFLLNNIEKLTWRELDPKILEKDECEKYKADFIRFLVFSHSSCLETINHLEKIHHLYKDTIKNNQELIKSYDDLGGKIYNFIKYVEQNWKN